MNNNRLGHQSETDKDSQYLCRPQIMTIIIIITTENSH